MVETNKYCTIYIVRHGETEGNVGKIVTGITDTQLSQTGQEQALKRAQDLKSIHFDAVFSSNLIRAKRTAEIIVLERQLAVNTAEILHERNYGDWEGRPSEEIGKENRNLFEKLETLSEEEKRKFKFNPGYESEEEIYQRFIVFLREVAVSFSGKTVLVVNHGSMMSSLLMHFGWAAYDEIPPGSIDNTGYIVLESDGVDFFVKETKGIRKIGNQ